MLQVKLEYMDDSKKDSRRHSPTFLNSLSPFAHILMIHIESQIHLQITVLFKALSPEEKTMKSKKSN